MLGLGKRCPNMVQCYSGKRHLRPHALAPWKHSEPEGKLPPGSILPHSQDIGESGSGGRKIFELEHKKTFTMTKRMEPLLHLGLAGPY